MREIEEGIVHWHGRHPGTGRRVSSHLIVGAATVVDPVVPDEGLGAVEAYVRPERIVLTNRRHTRAAEEYIDAFGCTVLVEQKGMGVFTAGPVRAKEFVFGDTLAPGVTALEVGSVVREETALRIDAGDGYLLFGDGLVNHGGRVGFLPDEALGADTDAVKRGLRLAAQRLLDQRFSSLLFSHGDPILGDGREALQAATMPD